jgi:hypothetical protein
MNAQLSRLMLDNYKKIKVVKGMKNYVKKFNKSKFHSKNIYDYPEEERGSLLCYLYSKKSKENREVFMRAIEEWNGVWIENYRKK